MLSTVKEIVRETALGAGLTSDVMDLLLKNKQCKQSLGMLSGSCSEETSQRTCPIFTLHKGQIAAVLLSVFAIARTWVPVQWRDVHSILL